MTNPIAQWQLKHPDFGFTQWFVSGSFVTAIGVLLYHDQGSGTSWDIYKLGNAKIALGANIPDYGYYYWNNYFGMLPGPKDYGMILRDDWYSFASADIGDWQIF